MEAISNVIRLRHGFFDWRNSLSIPAKIAMLLAIAGLTGLLAQVRIPLPFTPVPITGQVLAVLMAGIMLGRWWGGASMAAYAGLGIAGVPWFAGMASGLGATGGYIIGFIPAALFLGHFVDKYVKARRLLPMIGLMLVATLLYYIPGVTWLGIWLNTMGAGQIGMSGILTLGVAPFILGDIIKAVVAGLIALAIVPKENHSR